MFGDNHELERTETETATEIMTETEEVSTMEDAMNPKCGHGDINGEGGRRWKWTGVYMYHGSQDGEDYEMIAARPFPRRARRLPEDDGYDGDDGGGGSGN